MQSRLGKFFLYGFVTLVALFLLAPTLVVIPLSFSGESGLRFPPSSWGTEWYGRVFSDPEWSDAIWASVKVATLTVVIATVLGTAAALALVRGKVVGGRLWNVLLLSPMVIPSIVLSVGMFFVFSDWRISGGMTAIVIAHVVHALPYVIVMVTASVRTLDVSLEDASRSLGAGPWRTFRRVILPLIAPGVIAGALFAFVASWDEVILSSFLTSPEFKTLPVLVWEQARTAVEPTIAVVGTLLIVVSTIALAGAEFARGKGAK